ncbi:MAG: hydrogenase nickel incorporation protein HypB [Coriobacteriales bacterium]|jgi:hydrogenase nickel incorporation protein HypB|nr:hydrogenase nickel incorporation protein HypB [Coriobacteriales bacterium]
MKLDVSKPLLDLNDRLAAENRALFDEHGIFVLDLLASPGAGKTSTILATIEQLSKRFRIAVIEGDIASDVDSRRIKERGIPAVQINTGGACHLESQMIRRALDVLDLEALDLIVIENVGNLVCPTDFYLGEDLKVMILSVPEGHDKPLKYPGIFQAAAAIILSKIDTMPVFDFDERAFRESVRQLNPTAPIFPMSVTTGQGVGLWTEWLADRIERVMAAANAKQAAGQPAEQPAKRPGEQGVPAK